MNEIKSVCIICVQSHDESVLKVVRSQLAALQQKKQGTSAVFVYSYNNFELTALQALEVPEKLEFSGAAGLHKAVAALNEQIPLSKRVLNVIWVSDGSIEAPDPDADANEQQRSYDWWVAFRRMLQVEKAVVQILATDSQSTSCLEAWRQVLKIAQPLQVLSDVQCLGFDEKLSWRGRLVIQHSRCELSSKHDKFSSTPASYPASMTGTAPPPRIQLDHLHIRHNSIHSSNACLWEYPHASILQTYRKAVVPPHLLSGETYVFEAPVGTPAHKFLLALQDAHQMCFIICFSNTPPPIDPFQPSPHFRETETLSYQTQGDTSMTDHDWISYVARADDRDIPMPRYCQRPNTRPMLLVFGKRTQVIGIRLRDDSHFSQLIDLLEFLPCPFPDLQESDKSTKEGAADEKPASSQTPKPTPSKSKLAQSKRHSLKRTRPVLERKAKRRKLEEKPGGILEKLASLPCVLSYKEMCTEDQKFKSMLAKQIQGEVDPKEAEKLEKGKPFAVRFTEHNGGEQFSFNFDRFKLTYDDLKAHLVRMKLKMIKEERARLDLFCKLLPKPETEVLDKTSPFKKKPPKPRKSTRKYKKRSKKIPGHDRCLDLKKYLQTCTFRIPDNPNEKKRSWREVANDMLEGQKVEFQKPVLSEKYDRQAILQQYVYTTPRVWQKHAKRVLFPKLNSPQKERKPFQELDLCGWINQQVGKEDISSEETQRKKSYLRLQMHTHIEAKRQDFDTMNDKERMQLYLTFSELYTT